VCASKLIITEKQIYTLASQCAIDDFALDKTNWHLVDTIVKKLTADKLSVATAESCTGGMLASALTHFPGSSNYFMGSIVAYNPKVKKNLLNVSEDVINTHSIYSQVVAEKMAYGLRAIINSDITLSTTGVAGPSGAELPQYPVGSMAVAISYADNLIISTQFILNQNGGRALLRKKFCNAALLYFHARQLNLLF